jgi:hypothetical protein
MNWRRLMRSPSRGPLWVESSITCQTRCALQPGNVRVRSKNQPVPSLAGTSGPERQPSARSKAFSPIQNNSDLAQGPQGNSGEVFQQSKTGHVGNLPRPWRSGGQNKKIDAPLDARFRQT